MAYTLWQLFDGEMAAFMASSGIASSELLFKLMEEVHESMSLKYEPSSEPLHILPP